MKGTLSHPAPCCLPGGWHFWEKVMAGTIWYQAREFGGQCASTYWHTDPRVVQDAAFAMTPGQYVPLSTPKPARPEPAQAGPAAEQLSMF